ncbi:gypsy retrotransposon integrase-like protein 1 [Plakobranchus ocellatus]|uniref:Gypsy retrotransposon integrase-like protein 1 n=1 Tax=Plakobranchus ocellatus TaxID=259542 RepID=A0AAV3YSF8_9GAST|nr:gypsy retrotransposon integrase-like protein 1 [Plakobranchus ocellatus]
MCQQNVKKGVVPRIPVEKVSLVDEPFKRVAIDMEGPISPSCEAGRRFIQTLVDYAIRYAETVPIRKIETKTVAKALLDIYNRSSGPEEVLNDQGTQFMSDCMKEVCCHLGIKQRVTPPYNQGAICETKCELLDDILQISQSYRSYRRPR